MATGAAQLAFLVMKFVTAPRTPPPVIALDFAGNGVLLWLRSRRGGGLIDTSPSTQFGMRLLAVVDRAFAWAKRPALEREPDGSLLCGNACPEQAVVRSGGQPI